MQRKILLDCDPGHDDAVAMMLAWGNPSIELLGVTTVGGNQTLDKVTRNALSVATVVVSRMGRKTSAGFAAPYCARYIIIVIGTTVRPEAFRLRNMIMASLAVSLRGFSSWSCCMARRPMGVAALSRPSMLAEMFMKMDPAAG